MTETRWLDDDERRAWRGYLSMQAKVTARLHRQLQADSGLSLADFDVLVQLTDRARDPGEQPRARVLELAESLQWEKSRLSHHLSRMQRRGLVAREDCPDDGRGAFIVLTDDGRRAIERAAPRHVETVREVVLDRLTAEEVRVLGDIAERVLDGLDGPA
ncbi:MarR family transcriptional regulator [Pseudonocardia sediminis]|uniref:MarR family transcriptional regulator n=2 Tax=Pseudonocardia sediminis TaxID=1397368 RepID=A0A4Q7V060_PSEST|nr:MarR family transcriptional regulator [Pseudonocardia sediminis]